MGLTHNFHGKKGPEFLKVWEGAFLESVLYLTSVCERSLQRGKRNIFQRGQSHFSWFFPGVKCFFPVKNSHFGRHKTNLFCPPPPLTPLVCIYLFFPFNYISYFVSSLIHYRQWSQWFLGFCMVSSFVK